MLAKAGRQNSKMNPMTHTLGEDFPLEKTCNLLLTNRYGKGDGYHSCDCVTWTAKMEGFCRYN